MAPFCKKACQKFYFGTIGCAYPYQYLPTCRKWWWNYHPYWWNYYY